ncbi:MAG: hypothetical protein MI867_04585 [Pseudomonadales bacterium]|nr:hypothetical protein [Pseudomonadales bacterium]
MEEKFSTEEAVKRYLPLMHELAIRVELVAKACEGDLGLTPPYAREYAYLQFRRMCELIALGCLQLHGDLRVAQTKATKKEWNAERIMKHLHRNHPHSFPQAVERTKDDEGWNIQANSKPNALTRKEFKTLYNECGEVLHRGTIRTLESSTDFHERDYQKVLSWQSKIVDLMNQHMIGRANGEGFYITSLRTEGGCPECSIFKIVGDKQLEVNSIKMTVSDDVVHSYVANKKP